jgi:hypothetical protein
MLKSARTFTRLGEGVPTTGPPSALCISSVSAASSMVGKGATPMHGPVPVGVPDSLEGLAEMMGLSPAGLASLAGFSPGSVGTAATTNPTASNSGSAGVTPNVVGAHGSGTGFSPFAV